MIGLIPVKILRKASLFLVAQTLKDITNHSLKLAKHIHNSLSNLKPMSLNLSSL